MGCYATPTAHITHRIAKMHLDLRSSRAKPEKHGSNRHSLKPWHKTSLNGRSLYEVMEQKAMTFTCTLTNSCAFESRNQETCLCKVNFFLENACHSLSDCEGTKGSLHWRV